MDLPAVTIPTPEDKNQNKKILLKKKSSFYDPN